MLPRPRKTKASKILSRNVMMTKSKRTAERRRSKISNTVDIAVSNELSLVQAQMDEEEKEMEEILQGAYEARQNALHSWCTELPTKLQVETIHIKIMTEAAKLDEAKVHAEHEMEDMMAAKMMARKRKKELKKTMSSMMNEAEDTLHVQEAKMKEAAAQEEERLRVKMLQKRQQSEAKKLKALLTAQSEATARKERAQKHIQLLRGAVKEHAELEKKFVDVVNLAVERQRTETEDTSVHFIEHTTCLANHAPPSLRRARNWIIFGAILFIVALVILPSRLSKWYRITPALEAYTDSLYVGVGLSLVLVMYFGGLMFSTPSIVIERLSAVALVIIAPFVCFIIALATLSKHGHEAWDYDGKGHFTLVLSLTLTALIPLTACLWYPFFYLQRQYETQLIASSHVSSSQNSENAADNNNTAVDEESQIKLILGQTKEGNDIIVPASWSARCALITCFGLAIPAALIPISYMVASYQGVENDIYPVSNISFLRGAVFHLFVFTCLYCATAFYRESILEVSYPNVHPTLMENFLKPIRYLNTIVFNLFATTLVVIIFTASNTSLRDRKAPENNDLVDRTDLVLGACANAVLLYAVLVPLGAWDIKKRTKLVFAAVLAMIHTAVGLFFFQTIKSMRRQTARLYGDEALDQEVYTCAVYLLWAGPIVIFVWIFMPIALVDVVSEKTVQKVQKLYGFVAPNPMSSNEENVPLTEEMDDEIQAPSTPKESILRPAADEQESVTGNGSEYENDSFYEYEDAEEVTPPCDMRWGCGARRMPMTYSSIVPLATILLIVPVIILIPMCILSRDKESDIASVVIVGLIPLAFMVACAVHLGKWCVNSFHKMEQDHPSETVTWKHTISFFFVRYYHAARMASWVTTIGVLIGVFFIIGMLGMNRLRPVIVPCMLVAVCMSPFAARYAARTMHKMKQKKADTYKFTSVAFVLMPSIIFAPMYAVWSSQPDAPYESIVLMCGYIAFGTPVFAVLTLVTWAVTDFFGGDKRILGFMRTLCCCFILVPFFIILPALYYSVESPFSNLGEILTLLFAALMIVTCASSILANARISRIADEKKAKVAVLYARKALRRANVLLSHEVGIEMHNVFNYLVHIEDERDQDEDENKSDGGHEKSAADDDKDDKSKDENNKQNGYEERCERFKKWIIAQDDISWIKRNDLSGQNNANPIYEVVRIETKMKVHSLELALATQKQKEKEARRKKIEQEEEMHLFYEIVRTIGSEKEQKKKMAEFEQKQRLYKEHKKLHDQQQAARLEQIRVLREHKLARLTTINRKRAELQLLLEDCMDLSIPIDEAKLEAEFERILHDLETVDEDDEEEDDDDDKDEKAALLEIKLLNDDTPVILKHSCFEWLLPTRHKVQRRTTLDNEPLAAPPSPVMIEEEGEEGDNDVITLDDLAAVPSTPAVTVASPVEAQETVVVVEEEKKEEDEDDEEEKGIPAAVATAASPETAPDAASASSPETAPDASAEPKADADVRGEAEILNTFSQAQDSALRNEENERKRQEMLIGRDLNRREMKREAKEHGVASLRLKDARVNDLMLNADLAMMRSEDMIHNERSQQLAIMKRSKRRRDAMRKQLKSRRKLHDKLLPHLQSWLQQLEQDEVDCMYEEEEKFSQEEERISSLLCCWKVSHADEKNDDDDLHVLEEWMNGHREEVNAIENAKRKQQEHKKEVKMQQESARRTGAHLLTRPLSQGGYDGFIKWAEIITREYQRVDRTKVALRRHEDVDMPMSVPNLLAFFDLAMEFYSLIAVPFNKAVNWKFTVTEEAVTGAPLLRFPNNWNVYAVTFWTCIAIAGVYPVLSIYGAKLAKEGRLGHSATGKKLETCSWTFIILQLLYFMGSTLYFTVIMNLVNATHCLLDEDGESVMLMDEDVVCWSGQHMLYVTFAVIFGCLYYPIASFMLPQMQFLDDTLDVKFLPGFIVFTTQGKLFLAATSSFFSSQPSVLLLISLVTYLSFAYGNHILQPCVVRRVNIFTTALFCAAAWTCIAGLVAEQSSEKVVSSTTLLVGWVLIAGVALYIYKQRWYGFRVARVTNTA